MMELRISKVLFDNDENKLLQNKPVYDPYREKNITTIHTVDYVTETLFSTDYNRSECI